MNPLQTEAGYEFDNEVGNGTLFWMLGAGRPEPDGTDCDGLLPGHCPEHRCLQPDACVCLSSVASPSTPV